MDVQVEHDIEIIKAVAQAWHAQSSNSRSITQLDANRLLAFSRKPSRFRLEDLRLKKDRAYNHWNFENSLFDAYEIVSVSKRLESSSVLDHQFSAFVSDKTQARSKRAESKNSLRTFLKL